MFELVLPVHSFGTCSFANASIITARGLLKSRLYLRGSDNYNPQKDLVCFISLEC